MRTLACFALVAALAAACASGGEHAALYPARPDVIPGPPLADPPLQRATMHIALTQEGLEKLLSALVPSEGSGEFALLGARAYGWTRSPFTLKFDDARKAILAHTEVQAHVELPATSMDLPMQVDADVQPVLSSDEKLVFQAVTVRVSSDDKRVRLAEWGAGLNQAIGDAIAHELETLHLDLAPTLDKLHEKLAAPMFLPLGDADACFSLDVRGIEAGPSIFAGGFEKQLALVVAPSVTLPCTVRGADDKLVVVQKDGALPKLPPLPQLHNASSIEGGPFTLQVPIAAGYDELKGAMGLAFTDGKLYFSDSNPGLYIAEPTIYASGGEVVVGVKLGGSVPVTSGGAKLDVDGQIFLSGHPTVRDNFLEFPDMKPTVETDQALLGIAAAIKREELTSAVRKALRLDLSARLAQLKSKLTSALSTSVPLAENTPPLCTKAELGRVEIASVEAHDAYLRVYVSTTALASAYLPCPDAPAAPAAPAVSAR
ncbi:MAG TPA: DUF4403 family protein [Myxococcota bacterium]|jgi:hypothetical protein